MEIRSMTKIRSWCELEAAVSAASGGTDTLLFRGQSEFGWDLDPGIARQARKFSRSPDAARAIEWKIVHAAISKQIFRNYSGKTTTYLQTICAMQHFGLFTRLLDWTEDWRIALWFALEAPSREDSALWVVNKTEVEKAVQDLGLPKTIGENFSRPDDFMWQEMNGGIWFFSVEKEFRFPRITAQKGFFSISKCFAPHNVVLNELARRSERGEHRRLLWRLDISANDRDKFSRSLRDEFGMSTESLFPDEPLDSRTEELIADLRTLQNYLLNADPSLNASVAMEAFVADTPTNCAMGCTVARRFATHTAGLNGAGE